MENKLVRTADVLATFDRIAGEIQEEDSTAQSILGMEVRKALEGWLELTPAAGILVPEKGKLL